MAPLLNARAAAQSTNDEKIVRALNVQHINDAVMLTDIAVGGKSINCGLFIKPRRVIQPVEPFHAGPDWLQDMTISLLNRTNKTIAFGELSLFFLDTGDCKSLPCASAIIHVGRLPAIDAYSGNGKPLRVEHPERPELDWKPDERMVISMRDYSDKIEQAVSHLMSVTSVRNVAVYLSEVLFKDGMRWQSGDYSTPDPDHPGRFKSLPDDFFPGKRGHNWPPGYDQ
jgi:hypothetical protein